MLCDTLLVQDEGSWSLSSWNISQQTVNKSTKCAGSYGSLDAGRTVATCSKSATLMPAVSLAFRFLQPMRRKREQNESHGI